MVFSMQVNGHTSENRIFLIYETACGTNIFQFRESDDSLVEGDEGSKYSSEIS